MNPFDVFISYKHTDAAGELTEDYHIGEKLYEALRRCGISTFFSDRTLFSLGVGDYKKAIDAALDSARVLIVIGTSMDNLTSPWVEYEYETFYEDILSGRKTGASVLSYTGGVSVRQLPRTLSRFQNFSVEEPPEKVAAFVQNQLTGGGEAAPAPRQESAPAAQPEKPGAAPAMRKSAYTSDYRNELNRLRIQADNAIESDREAIDYVLRSAPWPEDEKLCILDLGSGYGHVAASRFSSLPQVDKVLCVDINARVIERAQILFAEDPKLIFEVLDMESEDFADRLSELMARHGIERFHILYSALTLHHLRNPNRVLRSLRRVMESGAYIILRGSDDGSKLCYPESELMESIIRKTMQATGVSDRQNGRKIYTQLFDSGFRDIRIFSEMRDLSRLEYDDRRQLFQESFSYRINYFKKVLDAHPDDRTAIEDHRWMEDALEAFEDQFFQRNFWYCEYDYVGVARK